MGNLQFSNGRVSIAFLQPEDATVAATQELGSFAAERQCRAHIASHPSDEFVVKTDGRYPAPQIEVSLSSGLLEKLPLLQDVSSSTEGRKPAPVELPCSLWGLVSLLVLLEGSVSVEEWFGGHPADSDPSLPASTLLVADFMGCSDMHQQVVSWLQSVVEEVVAGQKALRDPSSTQPYTSRICYCRTVLRCVHSNHDKAVYSATASQVAMWLPQALFVKWAAAAAPAIDLRSVQLTPSQWCMLAAGVLRMPADALTSMHLRGRTLLGGVAQQVESNLAVTAGGGSNLHYCTCGRIRDNSKAENPAFEEHCRIEDCGMFMHAYHGCSTGCSYNCRSASVSGTAYTLQPLQASIRGMIAHDHMQMLGAAQAVVSHTTSLHTLGLHDLQLTPQLISTLEDLFGSLPDSLSQLHLTTHSMHRQGTVGVEQKVRFFRAVAQVRSLKELHMPQWEAFVGGHADFCCEPLRSIAGLRIFVPTAQQSAAFPAGLTFQATLPEAATPTEATLPTAP